MRISLLLEREPFENILENTLASYWSSLNGPDYKVEWCIGTPNKTKTAKTFFINFYLNVIFSEKLAPQAFDPIRNEFGYSLVKWRRPFQQLYVELASRSIGARWLAQAKLRVVPEPPEFNKILIIPGNHKIRIVNYQEKIVTLLLKADFPRIFWEQEIKARNIAFRYGLPVPEIIEVFDNQKGYTEKYISGQPLNRLADIKRKQHFEELACHSLNGFAQENLKFVTLGDYLEEFQDKILEQISANNLLNTGLKNNLKKSANRLIKHIMRLEIQQNNFALTNTHGDFQPANILVDQDRFWLIDWEYSDIRQAGYDLLTFFMGARSPDLLAQRLLDFEHNGALGTFRECLKNWPGIDWSNSSNRHVAAGVFLLEELLLHLNENANPHFFSLGRGLISISVEVEQWLKQV
jgi:thiamine kinase-like enzyme